MSSSGTRQRNPHPPLALANLSFFLALELTLKKRVWWLRSGPEAVVPVEDPASRIRAAVERERGIAADLVQGGVVDAPRRVGLIAAKELPLDGRVAAHLTLRLPI